MADLIMYYTYVLKSRTDNNLYIGWTNNLKNRLILHNRGKVPITKNRVPFDLVYYEACLNEKKAIAREKELKTGFGRLYLKNRM
jgi:putative endonuclease